MLRSVKLHAWAHQRSLRPNPLIFTNQQWICSQLLLQVNLIGYCWDLYRNERILWEWSICWLFLWFLTLELIRWWSKGAMKFNRPTATIKGSPILQVKQNSSHCFMLIFFRSLFWCSTIFPDSKAFYSQFNFFFISKILGLRGKLEAYQNIITTTAFRLALMRVIR